MVSPTLSLSTDSSGGSLSEAPAEFGQPRSVSTCNLLWLNKSEIAQDSNLVQLISVLAVDSRDLA
jgi:hypothetical protein